MFIAGALILGFTLFELMSFSVLGSYFFDKRLHLTSVSFGDSALLLGLSYLGGTRTNRFLIPQFSQKKLCTFGICAVCLSAVTYLLITFVLPLSRDSLVLPNLFICFSAGFIFPNVLGATLQLYPKNIGVASATQSLLFMGVAMLTMAIVNHLNMNHTKHLGFLFVSLAAIQAVVFFKYFSPVYSLLATQGNTFRVSDE